MTYPLCDQTVTIYRLDGDKVLRRVAENCFFRWQHRLRQDEQGLRSQRRFLLIQPGENPIYPGDKIMPGIGPEVGSADWEKLSDCAVAAYAEPNYWQGKICHWEAGNNG